jgi:UDP-glucose 4-epimerase
MKVLITGIAGLIGTHFSKYLLDKNYNIIGIDNLSGGYIDNIDDRIIHGGQFHEIDLRNTIDVNRIFDYYKPEIVYHFAAYAAEGLSPFIRVFNYSNNIIASMNVINNCIKYKSQKLIFTSSMSVYGRGNPPFTEDQNLNPIDPYGIAKYAVEQDLKCAYDQFDLNYTIIRPHNIIGTYQNIWDRYRNVIGIWIRRILNNESILIYGDGLQKRAFSDIKYFMEPLENVMDEYYNGEIFNIGSDEFYTILEMANMTKEIAEKYKYKCNIEYKEPRYEVKEAYSDHSKAKKILAFKDETDVYYLIQKMFLWAVNQPKREVKNMDYELERGIYEYWK